MLAREAWQSIHSTALPRYSFGPWEAGVGLEVGLELGSGSEVQVMFKCQGYSHGS